MPVKCKRFDFHLLKQETNLKIFETVLLGCLGIWARCVVRKKAAIVCSSEKNKINSVMLAVSRALGGLL